jgi:hypothetical protein
MHGATHIKKKVISEGTEENKDRIQQGQQRV